MRTLWFDDFPPLLSLIANVYTMRLPTTRVVGTVVGDTETLGGVAVNSIDTPSVVVTTSTAPEGGSVVSTRSRTTTPYGFV